MAEPNFTCAKRGMETELAAVDPANTVCMDCCEDHYYQSDACAGWALCVNCNKPAPDDFYDEQPGDFE